VAGQPHVNTLWGLPTGNRSAAAAAVAALLPGRQRQEHPADRRLTAVLLTAPPQRRKRPPGPLRQLLSWLRRLFWTRQPGGDLPVDQARNAPGAAASLTAGTVQTLQNSSDLALFIATADHRLSHTTHPRLLSEFLEMPPGELPILADSGHPGLFYLHPDSDIVIEVGIKDASRLPVPGRLLGCPYKPHESGMCLAPKTCNCHKGRCTIECTLGSNIIY
jgi:hypothetical protein